MKYIYGLAFILFVISASVYASTGVKMVGGKLASTATTSAASTTTTTASACPSGTYLSAWNGDYTSDTDKLCYNSGASTKDGTLTGGVVGATYGEAGNGIQLNAGDERLVWAISAGDIINTTQGTIWLSLYINDIGDDPPNDAYSLFEARESSTASIEGRMTSSERPYMHWKGTGPAEYSCTWGAGLSTGTWYRVGYSWDYVAGPDASNICIAIDGTWSTEGDCQTITLGALSTTITSLMIGELNSATATAFEIWIDNFYVLDGFKTSDPYSP